MLPDSKHLQDIIRQAAQRELLPRLGKVARELKADGSIVTVADVAMQRVIQTELARCWPQYGFLGEEMNEDEQRDLPERHQAGFWCLDPLDGTNNFAAGIPFFAVSLALIVAGEVQVGVVYDPCRDEFFTTQKGQGAWLNARRLSGGTGELPLRRCIAVVDFKRLPKPLSRRLVEQPPFGSQRNFGSIALEWCWLAAGRFQVYLHGQQKAWDYSAGSLLLSEAGGHALTLEGREITTLGLQSCSVVAALEQPLFNEWKDWIKRQT